ncbi:MAG: hypothetical protein H8M99_12690 [Gloeobacteraceae cyanobacterium ES-bin-144]|nr:hypothetical protein [Verrucomicrobiales bacterium]
MSSFLIRPSFSQIIDLGIEETREMIVKEVNRENECCEVKSFPSFVCLRIPEVDRHFWSPRLNLSLKPTEDGKTLVEGTYGPNANVWSIFIYAYLITGSVGLFSGILGFCQKMIGHQPWGLWIFGVVLTTAAALYVFAQFGQKLGARQTFLLHQIYESAMGGTVEIK